MNIENIPDVGTLVEYGLDSFGKKPERYRVSGWLCKAPIIKSFKPEEFILEVLYSGARECGPDNVKLVRCARQNAEYLSLTGICGAIARVADAKVVGMVSWDKETLDAERESANRSIGRLLM